jgi:pimeloyl-ACP methyl ester carboxylesterase
MSATLSAATRAPGRYDPAMPDQHLVTTSDGRRLAVYEAGDPTGDIVLVHHGTPGGGTLAPWWAADAAARGIRLVGYDRPGYGGSDRHPGRTVADAAADSAAIADALGADRIRSWGASGGGPHALACAALLPDRVIAVATLASVAPFNAAGLDWLAGMGQDNLDEFGLAVEGEQALRGYVAEQSAQLAAAGPENLADAMRSLLPPVDVAALTGAFASFLYANIVAGLAAGDAGWIDDDLAFVRDWGFDPATITTPLLVVQGRHDLMVPFTHGQWLAALIPGCTARLTDDDGHLSLGADLGPVHSWLLEH